MSNYNNLSIAFFAFIYLHTLMMLLHSTMSIILLLGYNH